MPRDHLSQEFFFPQIQSRELAAKLKRTSPLNRKGIFGNGSVLLWRFYYDAFAASSRNQTFFGIKWPRVFR